MNLSLFKNRKAIIAVSVAILIPVIWLVGFRTTATDSDLNATVKKGPFEVNVYTTGELEAKNSVKVLGPSGMRSVGIWQIKISDMVPEGTVVKKGEYIASLDKTEIMNKIKDESNELTKIESKYIQTKLDTTLDLRQARDELVNLNYQVNEKQIVLQQSTYEPPATIRQAEIDLEKAKRSLEQSRQNYSIKENQARAKMQEVTASLSQAQNKLEMMQKLLEEFSIIAPEDGMLIYHREWNGKKRTVNSTIGAWDPIVATLPDLNLMISKTYVNEVDIRKIKTDQQVEISLDAFPEKKLTGKVISVANVGEQNPKSDAKVFEVNILINEKDTTLRPAMTTGNNIRAEKLDNVVYVPLEAIHNQGDSLTFVYKKGGFGQVKQEVQVGQTNDNYGVILKGLEEGETVLLSIPSKADDLSIETLDQKDSEN